MAKIIFSDITAKKSDQTIDLNFSEKLKKITPKKPAINLSECDGKKRVIYSSKTKTVADIRSKKESVFFAPANVLNKKQFRLFDSVFSFGMVAFILVFSISAINIFVGGAGFGGRLAAIAGEGYASFMQGIQMAASLDLQTAEKKFANAEEKFNEATRDILLLRTGSSNLLNGQGPLDSAGMLLEAAQLIARAAKSFSFSAEKLQDFMSLGMRDFLEESNSLPLKHRLTDLLAEEQKKILQIRVDLNESLKLIKKINKYHIPKKYLDDYKGLKNTLQSLIEILSRLDMDLNAFLRLLGDRYPHRIMVLFQNDSESRPTGGFIGSLMILDINGGRLVKKTFFDVYDIDGQLRDSPPAPEEVSAITDNWGLRDSNTSPDFSISAEQAIWFLQNSKAGPSVDTVLAVNMSVVEDLLSILGDIRVPELKQPLNEENFDLIISYLVESKHFGSNNPKQILASVIDSFLKNTADTEKQIPLVLALKKAFSEKKLMLWSRDTVIQEMFDRYNLTLRQSRYKFDYLQVLSVSIGGNKSDKFIQENLTHKTLLNGYGEIDNELTIVRKHLYSFVEENEIIKLLQRFSLPKPTEELLQILGKGKNVSIMKVYVPFGSKLQNTIGIDISNVKTRHDPELQKTFFLFEMAVDPGDSSTVTLRYALPEKINLFPGGIYSLNVDGQPSKRNVFFKKSISLSPPISIIREEPENFLLQEKHLIDSLYFGAVLVR